MVEFPWRGLGSGCIWLIAAEAGTYTHERVLVEEELGIVSDEVGWTALCAGMSTYDVATTLKNSVGGRETGETTANNDNLGRHDLWLLVDMRCRGS